MNPNRGESIPSPDLGASPGGFERQPDGVERAVEAPATPEQSGNMQSRPAPLTPQPVSLPEPPAAQADDPGSSMPADNHARGGPAADKDRIEKHWVERAKSIIEQTKDDPFTQKSEVSKVKAEYIKQRFNKQIKTDTGVA